MINFTNGVIEYNISNKIISNMINIYYLHKIYQNLIKELSKIMINNLAIELNLGALTSEQINKITNYIITLNYSNNITYYIILSNIGKIINKITEIKFGVSYNMILNNENVKTYINNNYANMKGKIINNIVDNNIIINNFNITIELFSNITTKQYESMIYFISNRIIYVNNINDIITCETINEMYNQIIEIIPNISLVDFNSIFLQYNKDTVDSMFEIFYNLFKKVL
jgi:hypothetical protein